MSATESPASLLGEQGELVDHFAALGVVAFTTGRDVGSFGMQSDEPVADVMARWSRLRAHLGDAGRRLATATQVHGREFLEHRGSWRGWLRGDAVDGHFAPGRGIAMAVTVADCVPVFLAHASGASAVLHSGWRGTAAGITESAIRRYAALGVPARELYLHCGPAICGRCYEVSAEVFAQLTGRDPGTPTTVDLRALIADRARALGVEQITLSPHCTRCDNDRFFSHRAGDAGRQLGVIAAQR